MKCVIFLVFLSFTTIYGSAQTKLSDKDFNNLIALAELYSHNNMCTGVEFAKKAEALKTPVLSHVIDLMLAEGKQDSTILQKRFLNKPDNDELKLWYTISMIHYNRIDTGKTPLPDPEIARKTLSDSVAEPLLVDAYYYHINTGLSMLFNTADLSHFNFDLDNLGLKNDTEKAIVFYKMMDAIANARFRVLQYMKNNKRIDEFANRMPTFNGKPYYYYTNLDIPDFTDPNYTGKETYQSRYVGGVINTLLIHFQAMAALGDKFHARELYFNSILHKPEFFKYSQSKETLQTLYDQSNK
jgi:hypothetical protein